MISVKALNMRIKQAQKTFGSDSRIYQSYVGYIKSDFPENYVIKNGTIQLKISSKEQKLTNSAEYKHLEKLPTSKKLLARGRKIAKSRGLKNVSNEEAAYWLNEREKMSEFISEFAYLASDLQNAQLDEALSILKQSNKSYEDLERVRNILSDSDVLSNAIPRVLKLDE